MYNENIGTFSGRIEDCSKFSISKDELIGYMQNIDMRVSKAKAISEEEHVSKSPKIKEFVTNYANSLEKNKQVIDQMRNIQVNNNEQITL